MAISQTTPHKAPEAALAEPEYGADRINALFAETRSVAEARPYVQQTLYQRKDVTKPLRWFMATDILALMIAFITAWVLAQAVNLHVMGRLDGLQIGATDGLHVVQFLMLTAGVILWFENTGHYHLRMPLWMEAKRIMTTIGFAMLVDGFLLFASKQDFSRLWLMAGWVFAAIGVLALRTLYRTLRRWQGSWKVRAMLVGGGVAADQVREVLRVEKSLGLDVKVQVENVAEAFEQAGESWEKMCALYGADYIVVALEGAELAKAELPLAQLARENVPYSLSSPARLPSLFSKTPHYFFNHDVMLMTRA